jgi:predicted nucleic acid-binding Zn ribbon protein
MGKSNIRYLNGYRMILKPDYYRAMTNRVWEGYVYEHIYVVEESLGRHLTEDEEVHHLDGNRENNRPENLLVLTGPQHTKLHMWLRKGAPGIKRFYSNTYNKDNNEKENTCLICDKPLYRNQEKTCSSECSQILSRRVERPTKDELYKLIWEMPTVKVAKKFKVSDKAIEKWCKSYGIEKPPRGYWAKMQAGITPTLNNELMNQPTGEHHEEHLPQGSPQSQENPPQQAR